MKLGSCQAHSLLNEYEHHLKAASTEPPKRVAPRRIDMEQHKMMADHVNEPPDPNIPVPDPDDIPQPDQDEIDLPPAETPSPVKEDNRPLI